MNIYAIGDLHLNFNTNKPMDVFGDQWVNYERKLQKNWIQTIQSEDMVLLAGDLSWAMKLEETKEDFAYLNTLPGHKLLIKGNHDYWWQSLSKMQDKYPAFRFIHNNSYILNNTIGICGTRGFTCPGSSHYKEKDEKIYLRELNRLELSLKSLPSHIQHIIVVLHYPPTNEKKEPSGFTELIEHYRVDHVIYGHLHGEGSYASSLKGNHKNIHYHLVSADYLDFSPKCIMKL
jgi:hypothetical protein